MRKHTALFIGIIFMAGNFSAYPETDAEASQFLSFSCRSFQPGEVIWARYQERPEVTGVQLHFQGERYNMEYMGKGYAVPIGLDLNIETGVHSVHVAVGKTDGTVESFTRELEIHSKEFPVKKLWVEEKFVTPPAEVTERIRRESQLLSSIYSLFTEEWLGEGSFIVPCEGEIFPNFGERRFFNEKPRSQHSGVDISAPTGTPVAAANSGRVVLATHLYYSGNAVIIDHGMGLFSIYCHFSELRTRRGEMVSKGDIIGEVGATGRVTGPHLHWGVKIRDSRIDPMSLVSLDLSDAPGNRW